MTGRRLTTSPYFHLFIALVLSFLVYAPGLGGGFIFDDFPNLIHNPQFPPDVLSPSSLVEVILSSNSGPTGRPLSMLSFAVETYFVGFDPFILKLTNLAIHLGNGVLLFLLSRAILRVAAARGIMARPASGEHALPLLVSTAWLLAPINLTSVLYVIQRMESLATLCTLAGLLFFVHFRSQLYAGRTAAAPGLLVSLVFWTAIGILFKESAALLPLYALVIEFVIFRFRNASGQLELRVAGTFVLVLILPMLTAAAWLGPGILSGNAFSSRPFTLGERLLTETRVMWSYVRWVLLPDLGSLSLYHDGYSVSRDWLTPPTTLLSAVGLAGLGASAVALRQRTPLIALGLLWFLAGHALTSTVISLELVHEHRNYLPSAGLYLVVFTLLECYSTPLLKPRVRRTVTVLFIGFFGVLTLLRALTWSDPVTLALAAVENNPASPRAQYELGLTLSTLAQSPDSRQFSLAKESFAEAAAIPGSGIPPEQALIFMHAQHGLPQDPDWWSRIQSKLEAGPISSADRNALKSLVDCHARQICNMSASLGDTLAMVVHLYPNNARLTTLYADFARNVTRDYALAYELTQRAVFLDPDNGQYWANLATVQIELGRTEEARASISRLSELNEFGTLSGRIGALRLALMQGRG